MSMIIITDDYGREIGYMEIEDIEKIYDIQGNLEYVKSEDNIVYIKLKNNLAFKSFNYESCLNPLEQELASYKTLKKHYLNKEYRDCSTLIRYYFGHIHYGIEFSYNKTHDEICFILYENLLYSIETGKDNFINFIDRMIAKIQWNIDNQDFLEKNIY